MDIKAQKTVRNYKTALISLWFFIGLSAVNILLLTFFDIYFFLSSYFSNVIIAVFNELTLPAVGALLAIVVLVPYLVCALCAKKHWGFLLAAGVLAVVDTIFVTIDLFAIGLDNFDFFVDQCLNLCFHVGLIIEIVIAIVNRNAVQIMKDTKNAPSVTTTDVATQVVLPNGETVVSINDTASSQDVPGNYAEQKDSEATRIITISRKKAFFAAAVKFKVVIDGVLVGTLKNGQSVKVSLSGASHAMKVDCNIPCPVLQIPAGSENLAYQISVKPSYTGGELEIDQIPNA